jgi:hypothetical protein
MGYSVTFDEDAAKQWRKLDRQTQR